LYEAFSTGAGRLGETLICMLILPKLFNNSVLGVRGRGCECRVLMDVASTAVRAIMLDVHSPTIVKVGPDNT